MNNLELEAITKVKAIDFLTERAGFSGGLGDKVALVYNTYEKAFPNAKPVELMTLIVSNRKGAIETANAKAAQKASVYMAWFGWEPPLFNNRMRAISYYEWISYYIEK